MSEEQNKVEKIEQGGKESELSEKDLEQVAGGAATKDATLATHKGGQGTIKYSGS